MQIGWANHLFLTAGENSEDGVGDDIHSWAYDGLRGKKWNKDDADYGHISGKDISNSNSSGASSISGSSSSSSSGSGSKISSLASGRNSLPSCTVESATAGTESSEVEPGNLNMRTSQSWSVGDVLGCLLEISGKTESLASGETEMLACISFTLNGVSLGVAFSDISFLSLKANSDKIISDSTCSSSSSGGGDTGGCLDKNVDMPGYFYPSLSLEDGEAVLLNIGQRPFSFPPSSDINVISSISLPDAASSDLVIEVIEEKIVKKKAATAKKGKKTKKEIAAEKEAEIEDARVSKELADTTAAAITERERKLIDLIVAPSAPYLPVLQALESEIRALVPLELTVSTDTGGKEKIEVLASLISEKKSSSSVAKKVNDGNDSHNSNQKNASLTLISDVQVESASALVVPVVLADPISYAPVLLESEEYSSSSLENLKILGLQHLKAELERRGLKAGGSLEERASRLFSVRGLKPSEINKKLKAKC